MSLQKTRVAIVIPARYGSSRLPGKPLADLNGKPMIQHVYERACEVPSSDRVLVATDDFRVAEAIEGFGGRCVMTSTQHPSGTDRLVEVMEHVEADVYVNLQGDEPLVRPSDVEMLCKGMIADDGIEVGTLCHPIGHDEAKNPSTVKVVLGEGDDALYFSRSPIPYPRDGEGHTGYRKHVGVYAYRRSVLMKYSTLPVPEIERLEKLEQLRLLHAGIRIRAFQVEPTAPGVDTPECLERVRALMLGSVLPQPARLEDVKLVITDVDGVLTDGGLYYNEEGECQKRFNVRDGLGIRLLEECGIKVAVVSGRDSPALQRRVSDLGISLCRFGIKDKASVARELMASLGAGPEETVSVGDDVIDIPLFSECGRSYAVADAPAYVRSFATDVLTLPGGQGAFRELADAILIARGRGDVLCSVAGFSSVMSGVAQ